MEADRKSQEVLNLIATYTAYPVPFTAQLIDEKYLITE
jgi:hypothetical protein